LAGWFGDRHADDCREEVRRVLNLSGIGARGPGLKPVCFWGR
jgi:hypothetical protein